MSNKGSNRRAGVITMLVLLCSQASALDDAEFVEQSFPVEMITGQTYAATITMRNAGDSTWISESDDGFVHALGSQNPEDNDRWGVQRAYLSAPVTPGSVVTINFFVTAPVTPGQHAFQWRMVSGESGWFGAQTPAASINVINAEAMAATFVSHEVPSQMLAGRAYDLAVTMRNDGGLEWAAGGGISLGSQGPQDNFVWGRSRVAVTEAAAPNQKTTFSFRTQAPETPGVYRFQWRMVRDGTGWFGAYTPMVFVHVIDGSGITLPLITESAVSPAFMEGYVDPGLTPRLRQIGNGQIPVTLLGDASYFADVHLNPLLPRILLATAGTTVRIGLAFWKTTQIDGKSAYGDKIRIRANDSLLFTSTGASLRIVSDDGEQERALSRRRAIVQFSTPGSYVVSALGSDGAVLGDIAVEAVSLELDPGLAAFKIQSEVGFAQHFDVRVVPASAANDIAFTSGSPSLRVVADEAVDGVRPIDIQPLDRGFLVVAARLSPGGPVIGTSEVEEFTLERTAMLTAPVVDWNADGRSIARGSVILTPYVADMPFLFSMFAHQSTFRDYAASFRVVSDGKPSTIGEPGFRAEFDPVAGETIGIFDYEIWSPQAENSYCHFIASE